MYPLLNTAILAARKAGNFLTKKYDDLSNLTISQKGLNNFASDADEKSQKIITDVLTTAYPDHGIIAEESHIDIKNKYNWIIDPLDGTLNFIKGFPHFCISIALLVNNKIELGVIYDPLRNELFTALRGKGAKLDDTRIRINKNITLKNSVVGTGFPTHDKELLKINNKIFDKLIYNVIDLRRAGSAALDLAYVAMGRLDAFYELGLKIWDIAAGQLLIKEAGGISCDFNGKENLLDIHNPTQPLDIAAANIKLYKEMAKYLKYA